MKSAPRWTWACLVLAALTFVVFVGAVLASSSTSRWIFAGYALLSALAIAWLVNRIVLSAEYLSALTRSSDSRLLSARGIGSRANVTMYSLGLTAAVATTVSVLAEGVLVIVGGSVAIIAACLCEHLRTSAYGRRVTESP